MKTLLALCLLLAACDEPTTVGGFKPDPNPVVNTAPQVDDRVRQAAEMMLRDVTIGGADPFFVGLRGCSKNDSLAYGVEGTNVAGKRVKAVVCCGWLFRGCTVRVP